MRIALLSLFLFSAAMLRGATYYAATNGLPTNDGSEGSPWNFEHALSNIVAGDTLKLQAGTYLNGTVNPAYQSRSAGTSGNKITLDGQNVATVRNFRTAHSYWNVQNITFKHETVNWRDQLYMPRGAHYITVSNCFFDTDTNYYVYGINQQGPATFPWDTNCSSYCEILNNEFSGGTRQVIRLKGHNNLVQSNYIHDIWRTEAIFQIYGANNIIRANIVSNVMQTAGVSGHVDVFETTGSASWPDIIGMTNTLVERNLIQDVDGQPVSIVDYGHSDSLYRYIFRNNLWIQVGEASQNTITHSIWYNNTFYHCRITNVSHALLFTWSDNESAGGTNEYAHNGRAFNNVFLHNGSTNNGNRNQAWYFFTYSDPSSPPGLPLTNCLADANYVSFASNGVPYQAVAAGTVPIGDGYAWDNQAFYETNGINGGDPGFVNDWELDFRLKEDSILIDGSMDLSAWEPSWATFTNDFYGNPRDGSPDIGAVEYVEGSIRYVATTGSDTNAGTVSAPWRTIQHGMSNAFGGMVLSVSAGVYDEDVTSVHDGTNSAITIQGNQAAYTKTFTISHTNIILDGWLFQGNTGGLPSSGDIVISAGARAIDITDCIWTNSVYWKGTGTFDSATKTITGDTNWTDLGFVNGQAIELQRGTLGVAISNTATKNITAISSNVITVSESLVDATELVYITGHEGFFIYVNETAEDITIRGNLFSNLTYSGIMLAGNNSTVTENKFYSMQGWDHIATAGTNNLIAFNQHYDSPYVAAIVSADVLVDYQAFTFENISYYSNWVENIEGLIRFSHWNAAGSNNSPQVWANNVFIDVNELSFVQPNLTVTNNLFLRVGKVPDAPYSAVSHAMRLHPGGNYNITNVSILNNIFIDCGNNSPTNGGWYNLNQYTNNNVTADYNYVSGAQPDYDARFGFSEGRATLEGGDPGFTDISDERGADGIPWTSDDGLRLLTSSKLVDAGSGGANVGPYLGVESGVVTYTTNRLMRGRISFGGRVTF